MSECPYIVNQECDIAKCEEFHIRADERKKAEQDFQNSDYWNDYLSKIIADAKADERKKTIDDCIAFFEIHANEVWQHVSARDFICDRLEQLKEQNNAD